MADEESESGLLELFEQASFSSTEQHEPSNTSERACKRVFNFELSLERCLMCGLEHDSPEFGPYCAVCHDFLYPSALLVRERETESMHFATSGETTSSESAASEIKESSVCSGVVRESEDSGCESESETAALENNDAATFDPTSMSRYKLPYLSLYERVRAPNSIAKRLANELNFVEEDLSETLPPESEFLFTGSLSVKILIMPTIVGLHYFYIVLIVMHILIMINLLSTVAYVGQTSVNFIQY